MTWCMGDVRFANDQLDDMVLLRSDGTPTYMLAVVVDDHDMGVTHVIRGADHLNNAARQLQIIDAMGWPVPVYGHLPLINGPDGAKLSKRHGALAVEAYRDMGYLPETMRNYLLRLGWSHGDDEIISTAAGDRMVQSGGHRQEPGADGLQEARQSQRPLHPRRRTMTCWSAEVAAFLARRTPPRILSDDGARAARGGDAGAQGAGQDAGRTRSGCGISVHGRSARPGRGRRQAADDRKRARSLANDPARAGGTDWSARTRWRSRGARSAEANGLKLGQVAQPLRAALTGKTASPPFFAMLALLGREESLIRLRAYAA